MSWEEQKRQDRQRRHSPLDRPLSYRRRRSGTASVIGILVALVLWAACLLLPLALMIAAIRWLWLNA